MRKNLILDTNILCAWLQIPGYEVAQAKDKSPIESQTKADIDAKIDQTIADNGLLVLPLATIIETGNHISQAKQGKFSHRDLAQSFKALIHKALDENELHWVLFTRNVELFWGEDAVSKLIEEWFETVERKLSLADVSLLAVAEYYWKEQPYWETEVYTVDEGLFNLVNSKRPSAQGKTSPLISRHKSQRDK